MTATRTRAVSILHVEDGPEVSEPVRELLEAEGWHVLVCPRGDEVEREAMGAGVDVFLRKPEGVTSITEAAAQLLAVNDRD